MLIQTQLHFRFAELLRHLDDGDAHRNLAGVILEDLADALHRILIHALVRDLQRDLLHFLLADAVERHDLQRVELRRDRRLVKRRGVRGELGLLGHNFQRSGGLQAPVRRA